MPGYFIWPIFIIVLVGIIIGILWLIFYPVPRDRKLFGNNPWNLLVSNVAIILVVVGLLWCITKLFNIDSAQLLSNDGDNTSTIWGVISQMADPGNLPQATGNARAIAMICAIFGIVLLSGFLVASIVNVTTKRSQKWQQGMLRYNIGFKDYVIIIGINDQTATIAKRALQRKDVKYVLIQTRQDVEKMRARLALDLNEAEEDRLVFYFGERTSREDVKELHPAKAVEIYILGEDIDPKTENDHDAFNIKCLENISQCLKDYDGQRKRCHVNLEYQSTFTAFKSTHIYRALDKNVEFIPFNVHEIWAKKVLVDNYAVIPIGTKNEVTSQSYLPFDSEDGISGESDKTVHLIIMGMNQMGTALASQAALLAHYPNFHRDRSLRTTITFIDDQALTEGEYFRGRYGHLFDLCRYRVFPTDENLTQNISRNDNWFDPLAGVDMEGNPLESPYAHLRDDDKDPNFMDIQWEFIQANVASEEVRKYLSYVCKREDTITTIAICFNHSQNAIATALYMPEAVYRGVYQILVYQQNNFDLIKKVETGEKVWKRYNKLRPFGMIERSYTEAPFDNSCAKMMYYLYTTGKVGAHRPKDGFFAYEPIGDIAVDGTIEVDARLDSEICDLWNQLGIVEKLSNIDMVDTIPSKLRSLGLSIDSYDKFDQKISEGKNLEYLSKAEHTRWLTERLLLGYRPLHNTEKEWGQLKVPQQPKDKDEEASRRKRIKKEIERKKRAHLYICSNRMLAQIDPNCPYNDMNMKLYIPQILRYAEWLRIMRMMDSTTFALAQRKIFSIEGDGSSDLAMRLVVYQYYDNDSVKKKAIWIMDSPVTQGQWEYFMGNNPVISPKYRSKDKPVVNVSRRDVENFLHVVRKKTGLMLDLPTREEWEMVAALTDFPQEVEDEQKSLALWIDKNEDVGPCKVRSMSFIQSKYHNYGVYDMLGNVWEWTKEIDKKDPVGKNTKNDKCRLYGGSWQHGLEKCDSKEYNSVQIDQQSDDIGFRLVWRFDLTPLGDKKDEVLRQIENLAGHSKEMSDKDSKEEEFKMMFNLGVPYSKELIIKALAKEFVEVEGGYFVTKVKCKKTADEKTAEEKEDGEMGKSQKENGEQVTSDKDNHTSNNSKPKDRLKDYFVKVDTFYMLRTPVTQRLWNLVMEITPFKNPSSGSIGDRYPQTEINWKNIEDFLVKLKGWTDINFRLPTSAQWEYAAKEGLSSDLNKKLTKNFDSPITTEEKLVKARRNVRRSEYPKYSGENDKVGKKDLGIKNNADLYEVAFFEPNKLGLYDMAGCVREWCSDFDAPGYFDLRLKSEEYRKNGYDTNPTGPNLSWGNRVCRGGGWDSEDEECESTYWTSISEREAAANLGFRLVLDETEYQKLMSLSELYNKKKAKG